MTSKAAMTTPTSTTRYRSTLLSRGRRGRQDANRFRGQDYYLTLRRNDARPRLFPLNHLESEGRRSDPSTLDIINAVFKILEDDKPSASWDKNANISTQKWTIGNTQCIMRGNSRGTTTKACGNQLRSAVRHSQQEGRVLLDQSILYFVNCLLVDILPHRSPGLIFASLVWDKSLSLTRHDSIDNCYEFVVFLIAFCSASSIVLTYSWAWSWWILQCAESL